MYFNLAIGLVGKHPGKINQPPGPCGQHFNLALPFFPNLDNKQLKPNLINNFLTILREIRVLNLRTNRQTHQFRLYNRFLYKYLPYAYFTLIACCEHVLCYVLGTTGMGVGCYVCYGVFVGVRGGL